MIQIVLCPLPGPDSHLYTASSFLSSALFPSFPLKFICSLKTRKKLPRLLSNKTQRDKPLAPNKPLPFPGYTENGCLPALALPSFSLPSLPPHPKYFNNGTHTDLDTVDLETIRPRELTTWWLLNPPPSPLRLDLMGHNDNWRQKIGRVYANTAPSHTKLRWHLRSKGDPGGWRGLGFQALGSSREGSEWQGSYSCPKTSWGQCHAAHCPWHTGSVFGSSYEITLRFGFTLWKKPTPLVAPRNTFSAAAMGMCTFYCGDCRCLMVSWQPNIPISWVLYPEHFVATFKI